MPYIGARPLFYAALAAVATLSLFHVMPGLGLLGAVLIAWLARALCGWKCSLAWLVLAALLCGHLQLQNARNARAETQIPRLHGIHEFTLRTLDDPKGYASLSNTLAKITRGPLTDTSVRLLAEEALPPAGSIVHARGTLQSLAAPRNPGAFDSSTWLRQKHITAEIDTVELVSTETSSRARLAFAIREGFRRKITAGLEPESTAAKVIRATVLGEKPAADDPLLSYYRNSGTLHVFAVSGMHVGMVGLLLWWLLKRLGLSKRWSILLLIPALFAYAWLAGNAPSAHRAAWMATLFLLAFLLRRRVDALNILGATLLAFLLYDPQLLLLASVQLSFGVLAAIVLGTEAWLHFRKEPEIDASSIPYGMKSHAALFMGHAWRWVKGMFCVSVFAALGSAPLTAWHFGLVTPVSIVANLFLSLQVFVLLAVALFSALLGSVWTGGGEAINRYVNAPIARSTTACARFFAELPYGHFEVRPPVAQARLIVYDLKYGASATCLTDTAGATALIDCGDRYSMENTVAPSLQKLRLHPDSIALTHADAAHIGGGAPVWSLFPIRQALMPVPEAEARSLSYRAWFHEAPRAGVKLHLARTSQRFPFPGGATLEVLDVPPSASPLPRADDHAAIYRLHWQGWKILFTSDSGVRTEARLLASGRDVSADVIVAGCHEDDVSLGEPFIRAVAPKAIILPRTQGKPIGRRPRNIRYWQSLGIRTIQQRKSGAATLTIDSQNRLHIEGFRDGSEVVLRR